MLDRERQEQISSSCERCVLLKVRRKRELHRLVVAAESDGGMRLPPDYWVALCTQSL